MKIKCSNSVCGKEFNKCFADIKRTKRSYCSLKCAYYDRDHHVKNKDFFETIDTEAKAYWLGFIYADGNLSSSMNRVKIEIALKDILHLKKFANIFNASIVEFEHKGFVRGSSNPGPFYGCRCDVCSRTLWQSLHKIGIEPRKSKKDLTKVFDYVPGDLMHHFIRGEFDGDGSICFNKNTAMCSFNGGYKFLTEIKNKILSYLPLTDVKIVPMSSIYRLQWTGLPQLRLIRKWLYKDATLFLERKKKVFNSIESKLERKVSSQFRGVSWRV